MGKNENIIKFSPQLVEVRQPVYGSSYGSLRAVPMIAGPAIVVTAMLAVHGYNLCIHWQNYVEAPPTISRALLDPSIAAPFAIAMIVSAFFLTWAVVQVAVALGRIIVRTGQGSAMPFVLLLTGVSCQLVAIAGMVVLSQFTGNVSQPLHDLGSYMLFFGHSFGTSLLGLLVYTQIGVVDLQDTRHIASSNRFLALQKQPRRAAVVAILGALFGVTYFGGKFLPDIYFFWQRTIMSVLEVVVIFSFLGFLVAFGPFMGFWSRGR
jgi:hypothetical protein